MYYYHTIERSVSRFEKLKKPFNIDVHKTSTSEIAINSSNKKTRPSCCKDTLVTEKKGHLNELAGNGIQRMQKH
eukprot:jgi/Picre1/32282/NNA_007628.t1